MDDSTVQVIGYWSIGDKESYNVSLQKFKLRETDTVSNELMTYEVDVTVIDSTTNSYSIEWFYHNYKTNSTNELVKKITSLAEDLKVIIETDEYGAIKGVKNWEEVRDYLKKSIGQMENDIKDIPNMDKLLKKIEGTFTSKAAIESASIQDAQQFYTFHGGRYLLNEVLEFSMQVPNIYSPSTPFDSKTTLYLDELNPEENNCIIRSSQEVDSDQLTNTTFEYLKKMAKTLKTKAPNKEEVGKLTNMTTIDSRIHGTGWLIYSILSKTISTMGATNIEERIIEIK
ncbi:MAG: hypothetical protein COB85_01110 [Bacteroidetes bacterium]|nr:MAG: hypothetical protein COB85_01110 [Bacteroidota bacterium]